MLEYKFNVGDHVVILSPLQEDYNIMPCIVDSMLEYAGCVGTVKKIGWTTAHGVIYPFYNLDVDDSIWNWPEEILELYMADAELDADLENFELLYAGMFK